MLMLMAGAYPEIWIGGVKGWGLVPSPPIPVPLEVGPLNPARGPGERCKRCKRCKLPSGVWGGAPAEIELGTF